MILSVEEARSIPGYDEFSDERIIRKLIAIETAIRSYTNNHFQQRGIRGDCEIMQGYLIGKIPGLRVGDTIEISESIYNGGLYVVSDINGDQISICESTLTYEKHVLVTKIEYPADVKDCAVNMLVWDVKNRGKVGVQSETLSRHSVTYYNMGADGQIMGYPVSIMASLAPYRKARC